MIEEENINAERIARLAHNGQFRRGGMPTISHPEAVAELVPPYAKAAAWLHDVIEDGGPEWYASRLIDEGISRETVRDVLYLTRTDDQSYFDYIMSIVKSGSPVAKRVKIADITHNLSTLEGEQKNKRAKYQLARYILEKSLW